MNAQLLTGLSIQEPLVEAAAANFLPPSWPPPDDFPVVIDFQGRVISRYGDDRWNLWPWAGKQCTFNFIGRRSETTISARNASFLRQVAGWWLWGPRAVTKASTLKTQLDAIKPLFVVCTEAGIDADELWRYPAVIETVAKRLAPSMALNVLSYLQLLTLESEGIGFVILDEAGLAKLARTLPDTPDKEQSAYIPPRIWSYQLSRLRACIEDYERHREKVRDCYRFCIDAYAHNSGGSLAEAFVATGAHWQPFSQDPKRAGYQLGSVSGRTYYGAFHGIAERFGIADLLCCWVGVDGASLNIKSLSKYLNLISEAGLAFILNYSLMRIDEGAQLRANCHSVERDELGYDVHLLSGTTSKTAPDDDARWICSPTVASTVGVMAEIAAMRMETASHDPRVQIPEDQVRNPLLLCWSTEPWSGLTRNVQSRKTPKWYASLIAEYPQLFDKSVLVITAADLAIASQMTTGLDTEQFAVGKVWPLAYHQLRRTGAVNMLASGLVSEESLQYQLKHLCVGMTRYYGQNYWKLKARLNSAAAGLWLKEAFRSLARELSDLISGDITSPHGEKRKSQILNVVTEKSHRELERMAQAGKIAYRRTIFGGCTNLEPCPYGGVSNFAPCMGFDGDRPCEHVLLNRSPERRVKVRKVLQSIKIRLLEANQDSPLAASLAASLEAGKRYLDVTEAA